MGFLPGTHRCRWCGLGIWRERRGRREVWRDPSGGEVCGRSPFQLHQVQ